MSSTRCPGPSCGERPGTWFPRESDIGVVQQTLRQVKTAVDLFATPEHRPAYVQRLADALDSLMRSAAPGSDHQLAFVRAFTSLATSPEHLDTVAGLLDGSVLLGGALP